MGMQNVTNEEIARYWKQRQLLVDDHLNAAITAAARFRDRNLSVSVSPVGSSYALIQTLKISTCQLYWIDFTIIEVLKTLKLMMHALSYCRVLPNLNCMETLPAYIISHISADCWKYAS